MTTFITHYLVNRVHKLIQQAVANEDTSSFSMYKLDEVPTGTICFIPEEPLYIDDAITVDIVDSLSGYEPLLSGEYEDWFLLEQLQVEDITEYNYNLIPTKGPTDPKDRQHMRTFAAKAKQRYCIAVNMKCFPEVTSAPVALPKEQHLLFLD